MAKMWRVLSVVAVLSSIDAGPVHFKAGGYEGITVVIDDDVPQQNCKTILSNVESTLASTSHHLFTALDGRAFFQTINLVLPGSWSDNCIPGGVQVTASTGESSDVTIQRRHTPGMSPAWTQQTAGCGLPGDQVFINFEAFENFDNSLGRTLVKEWAKYRYGVFDETGYTDDPIYPMCYRNEQEKTDVITGCSDFPIHDNGLCQDPNAHYNITTMIDDKARTSIMFAAEVPTISMFCDDGNHNRNAPTKHNSLCDGRSTLDVILKHADFLANVTHNRTGPNPIDTRPTFLYKKRIRTRYVLIIEDSADMFLRESWSFLRRAIRKWTVYDLPSNTEIGLVLANDTGASVMLNISGLNNPRVRDLVSSNIPYSPGDSHSACIKCAMEEAIKMLRERNKHHGPASSVILVIAPGMDYNMDLHLANYAKNANIRLATVNYPGVFRSQPLDVLAHLTGGVSYTVYEEKHNQVSSLLTTYFKLSNVLYNVAERFYEGTMSDFPIEIHRKELLDDGRNSITGSFVLSPDLSEPARFSIFTHNIEMPLIRSIRLTSPSQVVYSTRSDSLLSVKLLTVLASINETGTWTYTIERFPGNPQPHFIQVFATPKSVHSNVVRARFWTRQIQNTSVLALYTEVKRGSIPILGAKVDVTVNRIEENGTTIRRERFELMDTGNGDPDLTRGDGVYTRYYNLATGGSGLYTFDVTVSDNGNAYSRAESVTVSATKPCCGSLIPSQTPLSPTAPFMRILPPISMFVRPEDFTKMSTTTPAVGRIGDLRVRIMADEYRARLTWTAPDLGGVNVARYKIKYATTIEDITERYETAAILWDIGTPFPLSAGSETSFTLDFSQEMTLLDKPLYFAIRSYSMLSMNAHGSPVSNWVRVYIPSPPPPSTITPTFESPNLSYWPDADHEVEAVIPRIAQRLDFGLELILPVIGGVLLLAVLLAMYCYFCVLRRRDEPVKKPAGKNGITIVPQTGSANASAQNSPLRTYNELEHSIGLPIGYQIDDDSKKRYSIVHQQEQQLIEELKQQQYHHQQAKDNLAVISTNTLQRMENGGRTLSPYESWTASQLLHEHERRHSPLDEYMGQVHVNQQGPNHVAQNHVDDMEMSMAERADHFSPPVPPLPAYTSNGYPINYTIYGVHQSGNNVTHQAIYQTAGARPTMIPFNASLQGSLNSVNSGEKKRRNVTMV